MGHSLGSTRQRTWRRVWGQYPRQEAVGLALGESNGPGEEGQA